MARNARSRVAQATVPARRNSGAKAWLIAAVSGLALSAASWEARAQEAETHEVGSGLLPTLAPPSSDPRDQSVRTRQRPGYDPVPLQRGAFLIYPALGVGVNYADNIIPFAPTRLSDGILTVAPSIAAQSTWSRHALNAFVGLSGERFFTVTSENRVDATIRVDGRYDFSRQAWLDTAASYQLVTEPRTAAQSLVALEHPARYKEAALHMEGLRQFGRLGVHLTGNLIRYDYLRQAQVDLKARDHTTLSLGTTATYQIDPRYALVGQAVVTKRDYDVSPPATSVDRNATLVILRTGAEIDVTRLIRGRLLVGYLRDDYRDPRIQTISGLSIDAELIYLFTGLTTFTFTAGRDVADTGFPGAASYIATGGQVRVDHELLRNVILEAALGYQRQDYQGIDRQDGVWTIGLSGDYLLNRNVAVNLHFTRETRDSRGLQAVRSFDSDIVGVSIRLRP